jgi:iron complex transport system substrate-binding protein
MPDQPTKRVVSLIASATEIVAALGRRDWLVGRSHECDFPAEVAALPVLTEPKFAVEGSSAEIDARVRAIVAEGLSVYRVDPEKLREAAPDVIVTQDHCAVCAVSLADVAAATCDWTGRSIEIVSLRPNGLSDVWNDIRRVAAALDATREGEGLVGGLGDRLAAIRSATEGLDHPGVAFIEWIDPLMSGGNWMPTLITLAGGRDLLGVEDAHSPFLSWDDLVDADPDVVVIAPCGFDIDRTLREMLVLERREAWMRLKAVRNGRVYIGDGNAFFNRPGPQLAETAEILAEILHPSVFHFGHQGRGWINFS